MRTAFSNALYYPNIDIQDSSWLKTAVLFWDTLSTIVPEGLNHPYSNPDTEYLCDIGVLRPITVNSDERSVVGVEGDVIKLLHTPEIIGILTSPSRDHHERLFEEKMGGQLREAMREIIDNFTEIHSPKFSHALKRMLRQYTREWQYFNHTYHLDSGFVSLYMTILANKISENEGLALVTDAIAPHTFANSIRFDNKVPLISRHDYEYEQSPIHFEQGLLLDYIIEGLKITPDITLEDVVKFKNENRDELGLFKMQLAKLTQSISMDKPLEAVRSEVSDVYNNEFLPAYRNFKRSLDGSRIRWVADNFLKVSLFSTAATGVPLALLGMTIPQALLAGAGASVIASAISYNVERRRILDESPYSYLLNLKSEIG